MKMQRGEMVCFNGCLGYDYHKEDKTISINEEEAETVRYIFNRYVEGAGGKVIARELQNLGYKGKEIGQTLEKVWENLIQNPEDNVREKLLKMVQKNKKIKKNRD